MNPLAVGEPLGNDDKRSVDDDDDDDDDDDGDDVDDDDDDDQQLREQAHSVTTGNDHDRNTVTITQWSRSTLYCL